jgi:2-methylcitrate dehydratase PrpD
MSDRRMDFVQPLHAPRAASSGAAACTFHRRGARGGAAEAIEQGLSGYRSELLTRDEARRIAANITQTFLALSFQTR